MRLYKNLKGGSSYVCDLRVSYRLDCVKLHYEPWDGRKIGYEVFIDPHDYLDMAKGMLGRLSRIAGIEYKVFARVKGGEWGSV